MGFIEKYKTVIAVGGLSLVALWYFRNHKIISIEKRDLNPQIDVPESDKFFISKQDLTASVFTKTGRVLKEKDIAHGYAVFEEEFAGGMQMGPGGMRQGGMRGGQQGGANTMLCNGDTPKCVRPSDTCYMGVQLDTGNPMGGYQKCCGNSTNVNNLYNMGITQHWKAGMVTLTDMSGKTIATLKTCGPSGGRGMGFGGGFGAEFAGGMMATMRMGRMMGGMSGNSGTGMCGGNFRKMRTQVAGQGGKYMDVTGLIDSGTPAALMPNSIAQKLGIGGGGGQRGGGMGQRGMGFADDGSDDDEGFAGMGGGSIMVKIDPSTNPVSMPYVMDDRGQNFLPMPMAYLLQRVNIDLAPDKTVLYDVSSPQNVVTYDCKTNNIMGGTNPQSTNPIMQMGMMNQRMGRMRGMMGPGMQMM